MVNMPDEIYGSRKIIDLPDIITSTFDFKSTYNVFFETETYGKPLIFSNERITV